VTDIHLPGFDRTPLPAQKPLLLIGIMAFAMGLDLAAQDMVHFSSPGLFLLPAIAVVGMLSGMRAGLISAGVVVVFAAVIYAACGPVFHSPWDALARLCLLGMAAPIIAMVVGLQHRRLEDAANGRIEVALRQRARELALLADALQKSNKELDQFAYVTSHDLKAPLRGISNLSQWIEEDLGDRVTPEAHVQLNLLRGRVQRMEALINGLLEYAHVGRTQSRLERVDTAVLLADVIDWVGPPSEIKIEVEPGMPIFNTDKLRLQQVLTNLVENGVKHHGKSFGKITIGCQMLDPFYRFSVTDDGPGIELKYQDRIFGIFQTLLPRDRLEGTGIGLSLVKKVVESKGGKVWVESAPGKGATFYFTWPRVEPRIEPLLKEPT
jgi:signal transduction histidine kinase